MTTNKTETIESTDTIFQTSDIDLAAFLDAAGHTAVVDKRLDEPLAKFSFQRTPALLKLIEDFVTGDAVVSVKGLLGSRRRLFKAVRALQEVRS